MTTKRRLRESSIKGSLIVILFLFLSLKSCVARGETITRHHRENYDKVDRQLLLDSAIENTDRLLYLGYELALGRPIYTVRSDLTQLNHVRVGNLGVIVGGVAANKFGKLKVNAGLYYSDASLPYSIDLFTAGLSANVYLLRIGDARSHTFEPYFITSISQQHIKFFGNYLDENGKRNYSTSEEQFLAKRLLRRSIQGWVPSINWRTIRGISSICLRKSHTGYPWQRDAPAKYLIAPEL